ncbi:MAG: 2-oxoacid:acceptor oxidoreductase family protein [Deferrisomatales bacterium]
MRRCDVVLAGIGGQGVVTLGTLLKLAGLRQGLEVAGAERRGGAQREGPVTSNVRYRVHEEAEPGDPRFAPFGGAVPPGGAHLLLSLEPLEAARCLPYVNPSSVVISEVSPRIPTAVRLGSAVYPPLGALWEMLREVTPRVHPVAMEAACLERFGNLKRVNVVALGLASELGDLPVSEGALLEVIRERLPDFPGNREAFEIGKDLARG